MHSKTVCVLRWGAFGDLILASVLFPLLKADGYKVTVNTTTYGEPILRHNPDVDEIVLYETDSIPNSKLGEYWDDLAKGYDKFINLSESVEGSLLPPPNRPEFSLPPQERHRRFNINYYDNTLRIGGYPDIRGKNGNLYFSRLEEKIARNFITKLKGDFIILWALSGSAGHKAYPYTEHVAKKILDDFEDICIVFVGDLACQMLFDAEFERHPRVRQMSGKWPIRKSLALTKYANLVIGPETGVLNAAACFPTPKIVFLSHSSHENLSKYWKNVVPLTSKAPCQPCHQLHYSIETCALDAKFKTPLCMTTLHAKKVYDEIVNIYQNWRNNGAFYKQGRTHSVCG